jgi:hypothetical protein
MADLKDITIEHIQLIQDRLCDLMHIFHPSNCSYMSEFEVGENSTAIDWVETWSYGGRNAGTVKFPTACIWMEDSEVQAIQDKRKHAKDLALAEQNLKQAQLNSLHASTIHKSYLANALDKAQKEFDKLNN